MPVVAVGFLQAGAACWMTHQISGTLVRMRISRMDVQARLNHLLSVDRELKGFGAKSHKYILRPCLAPTSLAHFESKYCFSLPEEYSWFLTQVGNGGAGPYYGLRALHESVERGAGPHLSTPFPHTRPWNALLAVGRDDPEFDKIETKFYEKYYDHSTVPGAIPIADYGCGHEVLLVVTGKERGNIWLDMRGESLGLEPLKPGPSLDVHNRTQSRERWSFEAWYLAWLGTSRSS